MPAIAVNSISCLLKYIIICVCKTHTENHFIFHLKISIEKLLLTKYVNPFKRMNQNSNRKLKSTKTERQMENVFKAQLDI